MMMLARILVEERLLLENSFVGFKNRNNSCSVRTAPDDIPGVFPVTGPKQWFDSRVLEAWAQDLHELPCLRQNQTSVLIIEIFQVKI